MKKALLQKTIRFYERKQLITVDRKNRRDNNYKEYSGKVLDTLLLIRKLKDMGFTQLTVDGGNALFQITGAEEEKGVSENEIDL